jgi:hypothetical protein
MTVNKINNYLEHLKSLNTKKTTIDGNGNPGLVLHGWYRHTNVVGLKAGQRDPRPHPPDSYISKDNPGINKQ